MIPEREAIKYVCFSNPINDKKRERIEGHWKEEEEKINPFRGHKDDSEEIGDIRDLEPENQEEESEEECI